MLTLSFYSYCMVTWLTVFTVQIKLPTCQEFVLQRFGGGAHFLGIVYHLTAQQAPCDSRANWTKSVLCNSSISAPKSSTVHILKTRRSKKLCAAMGQKKNLNRSILLCKNMSSEPYLTLTFNMFLFASTSPFRTSFCSSCVPAHACVAP